MIQVAARCFEDHAMPRLDTGTSIDLPEESFLGGGLTGEWPGELGGIGLSDSVGRYSGPDAGDHDSHGQRTSENDRVALRLRMMPLAAPGIRARTSNPSRASQGRCSTAAPRRQSV